jgi:hypothetical protein
MRLQLGWPPWNHFSGSPLATFVNPLNPVPRTAILGPGFHKARNTRVFSEGWGEAARRYGPGVIAGGVDQLCHAARGRVVTLTHAVIVLTYDLHAVVTEEDRELLWRVFGVPLFEQYLNENHELLAMDCEVHAGLHVVRGCESLAVDASVCGCGSKTPRLARVSREKVLAQSA